MATVKVKFRPLAGDAEQGRLYIQIIHERQVKLISTPYIVNAADGIPRGVVLSLPDQQAAGKSSTE